jgi:hypothetical protein
VTFALERAGVNDCATAHGTMFKRLRFSTKVFLSAAAFAPAPAASAT